jgi:hypothetical protein
MAKLELDIKVQILCSISKVAHDPRFFIYCVLTKMTCGHLQNTYLKNSS